MADASPTVQTWLTEFLYNVAGFPQDSLPPTSSLVLTAQRWGYGMVPGEFPWVFPSPDIYQLAVNCAAASFLINFAPDVPTAANPTFFNDLRKQYGLFSSQVGLLSSTSDEGTSSSYQLSDWTKNANMQDLTWMKDPFGRQLLGLLQQFGSLWGLS
ncbi:hypothetical protein [Paraburkholderia tropica]|uniref:hypothetical protein n=1 Tax=Paraburkholderia tropica TaxID=92647 RepID=UPI002AB257B4|nr:hypothetical protein [Paraburkholderia tropica]